MDNDPLSFSTAAGGEPVIITVPETESGTRLDAFLAARIDTLSRSRIKSLIESGAVTSGGRTIGEPARRVNAGETYEMRIPAPENPVPLGQDIALTILFEDDHLIVIDKPAGLVVHPAPGNPDGTLVNALIHHCGNSLSGIGGVRRPGIVHRLDKETSGVMVAAKNDLAHQALAAQFADHGRTGPLERAYQALVWGAPRARGTIDAALGRDPHDRKKITLRRDGREAITHFETLESYGDPANPIAAQVLCHLETGRTHQIRVHLTHIGHPLIGDPDYGRHFRTKAARLPAEARETAEAMNRQALHACLLAFAHPVSGETLHFTADPPQDFQQLAARLRAL